MRLVLLLAIAAVGCDPVGGAKKATEPEPTPKVTPKKEQPKATKGPEWSGVVAAAEKKAKSIVTMGKADILLIKSLTSEQSAIRLGQMTPAERQAGLRAVEEVVRLGHDKVATLTLELAEKFAPLEIAVRRAGQSPGDNGAETFEGVCVAFPKEWVRDDGARHKASTKEQIHDKGLALALFERAKPPAASDYRRLQLAGLDQVAVGEAVAAGKPDPVGPAPEWFVRRRAGGFATSLDAERDLLLATWAVGGVLPESKREQFIRGLPAVVSKPNAGVRELARSAASLLP